MPKIAYIIKKFHSSTERLILIADEICEEYSRKGFDLTLRQLYYQFVARDIIPNNEKSYKRLGNVLSNARLAGLLDWNHMVDRTRNLQRNSHWDDASDVIDHVAHSFQIDKWEGQEIRVEVWVEKEALIGVIEQICSRMDVPFFACKGYVSQSEMWRAARRVNNYDSERVVILHLGDHDPSGIDMTRDIEGRLDLFETNVSVKRIALNMDQVEKYNPPPNPTKVTDSRAKGYIKRFGGSSWELDALNPETLMTLIDVHVQKFRDHPQYLKKKEEEEEHIRLLQVVSEKWGEIVGFLGE